ncbi:MAG: PAS domain S-box protein [Rhodoplanes sp.]
MNSTVTERSGREREAKIGRLVDANFIGIFIARLDGDCPIIEANDAFLRMLGYDRDDLAAGMTMAKLRPPEKVERTREAFNEMCATGRLEPFEKEYLRKDGSRLPVMVGAVLFAEDKTEGIGFVLDLTERKRVENELRQSEARFEEAQRIAHVGWWERDFTTNHVSLSNEVCRVFGVDPIELPEWHKRWLNLIHPEDRSRAAEAAAAAVRGGPPYDVEYRVVRLDGEVRIVHSQGEVTWDDSGRPLRQFGVLQDITELRHAEEEVRASEERFRTFVDHATDAFFLLDDQAIVLDVNRQACHSLGYSREELIGMHPRDFDAGLDEPSLEQLRQRLNAGETLTFETRHRRKDGTDFPVEIRGSHFEKGGRRILCLARDITERKKAEEELRASEARFRTFVDYATDAFFLLDDHSTILDVNRQACEGLGYSREELIGSHRSVFDVGLDEPSIHRMRQRVAAGETITFETRHRRKEGSSFPVEVRVGHLEQGGLRFLCLVRDITERKRAEEALRRSEAYLVEAQRLTRTGSWAWDPRRDIMLHCSEEIYRIYGVDPRDGVPKLETLLQRIHPEDRDRIRESTLEGVRKKIECLLDYRIVLPDGTLKYIQSIRCPILDLDGNVVEVVATSIDVTERKHAEVALRNKEAELAHANRLATMGQLTAQIVHEVSQPIGGAAASAEAALLRLESSTPDIEGLRRAIQRVISNTTRARDVIGRVRDLIKKAAPRKDAFDINEAIREVVALTSGEAAKNSVKLQTRLEANVPLVEGDRVQVQQVVLNLVVNAIEAMSEVGEGPRELCIISEKSDTDAVLVAVQDSGPGFGPEDCDSLFEAFYTTKPSGLGLGLSICRTIIEAHGGRLNAVANVPRGATFQFTLPTRHDPARGA